jgi:hypothetical protein
MRRKTASAAFPRNTRRRRLIKQRFLAKGVASLSCCILVGRAAVDGKCVARVAGATVCSVIPGISVHLVIELRSKFVGPLPAPPEDARRPEPEWEAKNLSRNVKRQISSDSFIVWFKTALIANGNPVQRRFCPKRWKRGEPARSVNRGLARRTNG